MSPVLVTGGGADDGGLEFAAAELTADEGWAAAAAGCRGAPRGLADDPFRRP